MKVPKGWKTIPGYATKHEKAESTVRYWVKKGLIAHKDMLVRIPIIPENATPIHKPVKDK